MVEQKLLMEEPDLASVSLVFELESGQTKNSYRLDTPQGSWEGKILAEAYARLGNLVVPEVQVAVEEGCEVLKQPLYQLDLFEVGLVLVAMVVVNPYYKKK